MKISISIPDVLFHAAEKLMKRMGVSRSEFYQRAVRSYIEQHRSDRITEALDVLYGSINMESGVDAVIQQLQGASLSTTDW